MRLRTGLALAGALFLALPGYGAPPDFGTNQGELAFDGVCNDPRFVTSDGDDAADRWHLFQDAYDCGAAYDAATTELRSAVEILRDVLGIADNPGTDDGDWARNGVCNDPRFAPDPRHPAAVEHLAGAEEKDATDCVRGTLIRQAWPTETIERDHGGGEPAPETAVVAFGDDSGEWAGDGECDDPRFTGEPMASSPAAAHILSDAADCRAAFQAKHIELFSADLLMTAHAPDGFELGDDSGEWAFDGECDDPRFAGEPLAATLNAEDARRDATDCGKAVLAGTVEVRSLPADFEIGTDESPWSADGICNDPRFAPDPRFPNAVKTFLAAGKKDASDCRRGYLIRQAWPKEPGTDIAFGDDSGEWAGDGECDDPRFVGWAMARSPGAAHILRDATDCREAVEKKGIVLFSAALLTVEHVPVEFDLGDDSGDWTFDGECDDPRFAGEAMATTLREEDERRDATDCGKALWDGTAVVRNGQ